MTVTASSLICEAIRDKRLLQFDYRGLQRIVAPYCHGTSTRGTEVVRAVQVRGASSAGGYGFGKLWTVADIAHPVVLDESFVADDPDYNPDDSAMIHIHCRA